MTEYMGNIYGSYEAKPSAFPPGAASLHSCMSGHGPDAEAFEKSSTASEDPIVLADGISFMFESTYIMRLTKAAMDPSIVDTEYYKCWESLESHFNHKIEGSW
jgi:homogentisate 1,2-dioxygenase